MRALQGDITKVENVDYICNAANGWGCMTAGVSGAIGSAGGYKVQVEAIRACMKQIPLAGELYVTSAGKLPYAGILHLVTMWMPGIWSSLQTVEKCLYSLITHCKVNNIDHIALPALGTGTGMLNVKSVANLYVNILRGETIDFVVVDINHKFIDEINLIL